MDEVKSFGDVTTVLLAGGFGTRVANILPNLPRPMAPGGVIYV